jgi:hypothetical protein
VTSPVDLTVKPVNIKLSVSAHARAKDIARRHGFKLQDVFSAALLEMPEDDLVEACRELSAATQSLPKAIRGVMAQAHRMTAAEKQAIIDALLSS